ncbi:Lrp/AsnC family leucine-responsive transcriptional regulator [Variovorax boronicumulans]|uniref:Lrp/AsnC family transcriptional regulator n=1 Tax=Variovorax TaxID=34072 RepID=UPI002784AF2A|nr:MULTISPECIES: Lrp/AsnC family transcriptional regulator [Variovorax]MDP9990318.1 Lrp/AsnC family leucine-responsive transcriptional regulator [Variovorax boronicumulans]MDQ0001172.1 Lrp/AsnC family leucine-responsive transcriptional regulator [Variovorax boronicumulans]MDQ0606393.1 Lrp/AsnC family leucine-responsive transcriptional regulator [Variovorax sp. W1I1]
MLDDIDENILAALGTNARMSLKDLALQVGLSSPSVAERLRRLEERDVIRGYTLALNPKALGYQFQAIVRIRPLPGQLQAVQKLIEDTPQFCECDKVTGEDCFIARLLLQSIEQLDGILDHIAAKAETNTAIVKAHTIARRLPPLRPPEISGR